MRKGIMGIPWALILIVAGGVLSVNLGVLAAKQGVTLGRVPFELAFEEANYQQDAARASLPQLDEAVQLAVAADENYFGDGSAPKLPGTGQNGPLPTATPTAGFLPFTATPTIVSAGASPAAPGTPLAAGTPTPQLYPQTRIPQTGVPTLVSTVLPTNLPVTVPVTLTPPNAGAPNPPPFGTFSPPHGKPPSPPNPPPFPTFEPPNKGGPPVPKP